MIIPAFLVMGRQGRTAHSAVQKVGWRRRRGRRPRKACARALGEASIGVFYARLEKDFIGAVGSLGGQRILRSNTQAKGVGTAGTDRRDKSKCVQVYPGGASSWSRGGELWGGQGVERSFSSQEGKAHEKGWEEGGGCAGEQPQATGSAIEEGDWGGANAAKERS